MNSEALQLGTSTAVFELVATNPARAVCLSATPARTLRDSLSMVLSLHSLGLLDARTMLHYTVFSCSESQSSIPWYCSQMQGRGNSLKPQAEKYLLQLKSCTNYLQLRYGWWGGRREGGWYQGGVFCLQSLNIEYLMFRYPASIF